MGGNIDKNINQGEGPYVFRVNGQIHHRIGALLPKPNQIPKSLLNYTSLIQKMRFKTGSEH